MQALRWKRTLHFRGTEGTPDWWTGAGEMSGRAGPRALLGLGKEFGY